MGHLRNSVCQNGLIGFLVLALIYPSMSYAKDELRTWTDKSGRNKIKAKFVKLEADVVTLEKDDGEEIEIELKKLSTADAKFATQAAKESEDNPFKSKSKTEDPFKAKSKSKSKNSKPAKEEPSDEVEENTADDYREIKVDTRDAEKLVLSANDRPWSVEISKRETAIASEKLKPISIAATTTIFEHVAALEIGQGAASKTAVVGYLCNNDKGAETTRISFCDLSTGKSSNPAKIKAAMIPIALHDDGKQVLMRREEWGHGDKDRLEVWTTKGTKIIKLLGWVPYPKGSDVSHDVAWAKFISAEKLATCNASGKIVVWKYPEIEPLFQVQTVNNAIPALSPDRKYLAYCTAEDMGLIDIEKQEVLVQQPTPVKLPFPQMSFSRSGVLLGCFSSNTVYVWDVATGELRHEIQCLEIPFWGRLDFINDRFVLVQGMYLVDIENEVQVWTYSPAVPTQIADGITYFAAANGDRTNGALLRVQLPHPEAADALKKALDDPNLFTFKPNTIVRIDVSRVPDGSHREKILKELTARLAANGCKAGADGTVDLVASVSGPKQTTLKAIGHGQLPFKEFTSEVKLVSKGTDIWTVARTNRPTGMTHLKVGESMATHLQGFEKPDYDFFNTVNLPKRVQKPGPNPSMLGKYCLGLSGVSPKGIITEGSSKPGNIPPGVQRKR